MSDAVCVWCGRPGWSDTGTCEEYVQTAKCPGRDDRHHAHSGRRAPPTCQETSDGGYPVDSVIDPDVRALAELRAMGPARLLAALRTQWTSVGVCNELIDVLGSAWGEQ